MLFLDFPTRSLSVYGTRFFLFLKCIYTRARIGAFYVVSLGILEPINFPISKL